MTIPLVSSVLEAPDLGDLRRLSDDGLMQLQRDLAGARRRLDAASASVVGELARRSARDLGYDGLAQRLGTRTVEKLVSNLTGMSASESRAMVVVGEAMTGEAPWLKAVADRVAAGEVSVGAAAAIRSGLGEPNADVDAEQLAVAAEKLVAESATQAPEKVARDARQARDRLDAAGVVDREVALRERRSLRLYALPDGMTRLTALLDPESAALVSDAIDRVTMPRRGGVRFVDPAEEERAARLESDQRTTEQIAVDALVQFVRMAAGADDGSVFGVKEPAVRVHVRLADLQRGEGAAYAEGQAAALGMPTVHRFVCAGGVVPVLFDDAGRTMNVGRAQRYFTERQRIAIAARDGGCLIDGCDRPPSWTEAHHINPWELGGRTDTDDGAALCRHHHLWLHNTNGRISRSGAIYRLHPGDGSPPVVLHSKHPLRLAG